MDRQHSLIIKQGLKFSLGAALLGSFFWHRADLLDNYVYPTFGYVSVLIEPAAGGAIIAGLGRVGGSALGGFIAAVLVNSFGLYGSGLFIIPPITYILSALICETYRWQAAYSQATLIGTLIAMRFDAIRQQYLSELQAIAKQTVDAFNQLSAIITAPMLLQSSQTACLVQEIESIAQQLLSQRVESRSYPLEQLIAFSSAFMTMKAIASNLNRTSQTLPSYAQ